MRALAFLLACWSSAALAGTGTYPIVNGSVEDGFPGVVGIGAGAGQFLYVACTGTLITPRLVLTAGHCGDDYSIELIVAFGRAFVGTDPSQPDHVLNFDDFYLHPEYAELGTPEGGDQGRNDMAVLVLAEDAPAEVPPHWFNRRALVEDDVGAEVRSVGYGLDEDGNSGIKRSAAMVVGYLDDPFILSNNASNPNNANICSGDSGGPMLHQEPDGSWHIWGVHSWGDNQCAWRSGSTRTDLYVPWLMGIVQEVHGTDDVCALNGLVDDGVCQDFCDPVDPDCLPDEEPGDDDDSAGGDDDDGAPGSGCRGGAALLWFGPLLALLRRR